MLYFPAENAAKSSGNFPQNRHLNTSKIHRKTPPKTLKKQQKNFSKPPRIPDKYPWKRPQIPLEFPENYVQISAKTPSISSYIPARFQALFPPVLRLVFS